MNSDRHLLGIDLERSIEGLPLLGGHALYFDSLTLDEVLVLLVRDFTPLISLGMDTQSARRARSLLVCELI